MWPIAHFTHMTRTGINYAKSQNFANINFPISQNCAVIQNDLPSQDSFEGTKNSICNIRNKEYICNEIENKSTTTTTII